MKKEKHENLHSGKVASRVLFILLFGLELKEINKSDKREQSSHQCETLFIRVKRFHSCETL